MAGWREHILKDFVPEVARLTLVADPDGLLGDERIQEALRERGFEVLAYGEDPVAFRFLYESRFRAAWDGGTPVPDLVVVVPGGHHELRMLPPDLLQRGRVVEISLADLFPQLAVAVLADLDRADLDRLYQACQSEYPPRLGDGATRDFVLRHVFGIAPETITVPHQLLRTLLQQHFPGRALPPSLAGYAVRRLRQGGRFAAWPLEEIVPSREAFLRFLQDRWPAFAQRWLDEQLHSVPAEQRPKVKETIQTRYADAGPLPFDHPDVRVYVDNLFLEGLLDPVEVSRPDLVHRQPELRGSWAALGLKLDPAAIEEQRLERLLARAEAALPGADALHGDWQVFAAVWAEWLFRWYDAGAAGAPFEDRFLTLRAELDRRFLDWMRHRYGGLHNLASAAPVMLHHVPRALARELADGRSEKVALLVMDGLSLDQWALLRRSLLGGGGLAVEDGSVFSWVPTITPVARQALFSGRAPVLFADTIHRTDRDEAGWMQFWTARDVPATQVRYANAIHREADLGRVEALATHPHVRVLGLVVDVVDRTMHGMEHGAAGMHAQLLHWAGTGFLRRLVDLLLAQDFTIFLTSDHGSVEAEGIGRPTEGASADVRGERVRIYPDDLLRQQTLAIFSTAIPWDSMALPPGYLPLLAPARKAFAPAGERVLGHGGVCLEEVVVPFAQIRKKTS